ncbi:hypothetical protein LJB71_00415 [Thermomonas sp. S9]|nr:hypothetical protein [Thermomonas sp. S9]
MRETCGHVHRIDRGRRCAAGARAAGGDARLIIEAGTLPFDDVRLGESIAVNGCCLTVVAFDVDSFAVDASRETLALTTLGQLPLGAPLNLERALRPSDRLGGHLVSGHVDGLGQAEACWEDARAVRWRFPHRAGCCATSRTRARCAWTASA